MTDRDNQDRWATRRARYGQMGHSPDAYGGGNAEKLDALHMAMTAWPRDTIVGIEQTAFLVRYDGTVYRITVEPA